MSSLSSGKKQLVDLFALSREQQLTKQAYSRRHGMINRCYCSDNIAYHRYGGRGIRVCDRWIESCEAFMADMGFPPTAAHEIDRIDNDGDYAPGNCRWATRVENIRNSTAVKLDSSKVSEIKFLLNKGLRNKFIADKYQVSKSCIYAISTGKSWADIEPFPMHLYVKRIEC